MSYDLKPLMGIQGDVALILDPKIASEGMVFEEIRSRYPDITTLLTDELTNIEFIRKNTETIISRGWGEECTDTLYLLPLFTGVSSDTDDTETQRLYDLLNTFKAEVDTQYSKVVKVMMAKNLEEKYLKKCAEAVFTGSNTQIRVIHNKKKAREILKPTSSLNSGWPRLPETTGKVIVKLEGKNYADALKEVRQNIDIQTVVVQIENIKRTAKGDVIFEVKGGKDKTPVLKGAIEDKIKSTRVEVKSSESIVHISDNEADITEEDILDAIIRGTTGGKHEEFKVVSIRPNHSGNKNAIVSLNKFVARELIKSGSIRIGWVPCRVRSRVIVIRCYRCLISDIEQQSAKAWIDLKHV